MENNDTNEIAEGFFNQQYLPKGYRAISARIRPVSQNNTLAVRVRKKVGIDISSQKSKIITEDIIGRPAKSVNMGSVSIRLNTVWFFINNVINGGIEDPNGAYQ